MSFTMKNGDLLSDMLIQITDRNLSPLDLTNASQVLVYIRAKGESTNVVDGGAMHVESPATAGKVSGPAISLTTLGSYRAYLKVLYGSIPKRIPSKGYIAIKVEENFE